MFFKKNHIWHVTAFRSFKYLDSHNTPGQSFFETTFVTNKTGADLYSYIRTELNKNWPPINNAVLDDNFAIIDLTRLD